MTLMERRTILSAPLRLRHHVATGSVLALFTLLSAIVIAFVIPALSAATDGTFLVVMIVGVLLVFAAAVWRVRAGVDAATHPERTAWQQFVSLHGPAAHQPAEAGQWYEFAAHTLFAALNATSASVWAYRAEDNILTLAHFEGVQPVTDPGDLPVDLAAERLLTVGSVTALPESALRRGWMALGVQVVCPLRWREQLLGTIGLGAPRDGGTYRDGALRLLEWQADQVAQVVRNLQLEAEVEDTRDHLRPGLPADDRGARGGASRPGG